jgi:sugar O-acyltransferase (sialic acid O-acetyltransferase NeuD family)
MNLLIAGAGGHGCVVAEAAETTGLCSGIAFLDDRYPELRTVAGWKVVGRLDELERHARAFEACTAAIGDVRLRLALLQTAERRGFAIPVITHARATVSSRARVEVGSFIAAGAIVSLGSDIGRGCIINTGATVDHDCTLGPGVHVCPGAHLGGGVSIGPRTWFGIGAVAIQGVRIGSDVTVGAGAVCLKDVPDGAVVFGVPARERRNE